MSIQYSTKVRRTHIAYNEEIKFIHHNIGLNINSSRSVVEQFILSNQGEIHKNDEILIINNDIF